MHGALVTVKGIPVEVQRANLGPDQVLVSPVFLIKIVWQGRGNYTLPNVEASNVVSWIVNAGHCTRHGNSVIHSQSLTILFLCQVGYDG